MKKILFAAALVAVAATSCMKNEEMDVTSGAASSTDGAIAFYSGTSGSTKASEITTTTLTTQKFLLYSYTTTGSDADGEFGTDSATAHIDGDVLSNSNYIWSCVYSYFWPTTDNTTESFFAVTNSKYITDSEMADVEGSTTYPSFEYTVQDVEDMEDILVAQTLDQTSGTVALDFYHALAKVNFSAVGGGDGGEFDYRDEVTVADGKITEWKDYDGNGVLNYSSDQASDVTGASNYTNYTITKVAYTLNDTEDDDNNGYYYYTNDSGDDVYVTGSFDKRDEIWLSYDEETKYYTITAYEDNDGNGVLNWSTTSSDAKNIEAATNFENYTYAAAYTENDGVEYYTDGDDNVYVTGTYNLKDVVTVVDGVITAWADNDGNGVLNYVAADETSKATNLDTYGVPAAYSVDEETSEEYFTDGTYDDDEELNKFFVTGNVSYTYDVKSVTVTGLYDQATFTFGDNENSNTPGYWASQAFANESSSYAYDLTSLTTTSMVDDATISLKQAGETNSLFIMPQSANATESGFTITVEYTVTRNDTNEIIMPESKQGYATATATITDLGFVENSNTLIKMTIPTPGEIITFKTSVSGTDEETVYSTTLTPSVEE